MSAGDTTEHDAAFWEAQEYADPVSALEQAVDLLRDIVEGDKLYDPGTEDEHESRGVLLAEYFAVLRRAENIIKDAQPEEDDREA